jgi:lysophospholipase L1-like esterase
MQKNFLIALKSVALSCAVVLALSAFSIARSDDAPGAKAQDANAPAGSTPGAAPSPRLLLPPIIYAAPGREANLYFDNVVLAPPGRDYLFDVTCAKGAQQEERWTWTPTEKDSGDYALSLEVRDSDDRVLATGSTLVRVAKADAGAGKSFSLLVIGDSLTNASIYTGELLKLFAAPENATVKLLGTNQPTADPANVHEGYGGWRFETFISKYEPKPQEKANLRTSPFVFLENDKPTFNFPRYVQEKLGGVAPDVITIMLGTNDVFSSTDDNLEENITTILNNADTLLAGLRAGAPNAKIGLVTTVPPSASQDAFGANYGANQTRWQYRKNQHRLDERMMEKYKNREAENLWVVPAYLNLDCVHNFPQAEVPANARNPQKITRAANGVHPAAPGYYQIADSIYSWLVQN